MCNFRNPCIISAPKRRKKNGKGVRYSSSKDPSNIHKKHLLSTPTFYILFIFCIIRYDSDTLNTD